MLWKKKKLRDSFVFVKVRPDGSPAVDNHQRVEIIYKPLTGAKVYRASVRNLEPTGDPQDEQLIKISPPQATNLQNSPSASPVPDNAIVIYTDGACTGNPGPMGLGAVTLVDSERKELSLYLGQGTNNIAELAAIQYSLQAIPKDLRSRTIVLHTDSSYSIGVLQKGWKAKANVALVSEIRQLLKDFTDLRFVKVKGHAGIPENERCDELARQAIEQATS